MILSIVYLKYCYLKNQQKNITLIPRVYTTLESKNNSGVGLVLMSNNV